MGNWRYKGIDNRGKSVQGIIEAKSEKEVKRKLRLRNIRPKKISPPSILEFDINEWMVENGFSKPFGKAELMNFTKQLAIMINAGVPIIQSLEIIYKSERHLVLKKSLKSIMNDVSEGKTISESMSTQQGFDKLYCSLIKAGESGGILDTILEKLAIHMDKQEKLKKQIKSALTYPAIVIVVGIGVVWALLTFVVPQFVDMIKDSGKEIPAITQFVINVSNFLGNNILLIIGGFVGAVVLFLQAIKTKEGKKTFDYLVMKVPLFGEIILKGNLGGFCRTLATMLSAGVPLIDALDICIGTIDNVVVKSDIKVVKDKIVQGKTLAEPLSKITYFPDMISSMISVGEQTGNIDSMLEKVADVFEEQVSFLVGNMTKLIEPFIIVVLGGIIAAVLVAMYLPMFMSAEGV